MLTPGIKSGKLNLNGQQVNKPGDYEIDLTKLPEKLKNKEEMFITVVGTLPDGEKITSKVPYRIKDIPPPIGKIFGEKGSIKLSKGDLMNSFITAEHEGFDFKLPLQVLSFRVNIQGKGVYDCDGDELSVKAKNAIKGIGSGSTVTFSRIETKGIGVSTPIPPAALIEVTIK